MVSWEREFFSTSTRRQHIQSAELVSLLYTALCAWRSVFEAALKDFASQSQLRLLHVEILTRLMLSVRELSLHAYFVNKLLMKLNKKGEGKDGKSTTINKSVIYWNM